MAVPFGGWANNPAQGGKNMRYWGGNVWTNGEDPTGGRGVNWQSGGSITPSSSPTSSVGSGGDYQSILSAQTAARQANDARLKAEQDAVLGKYTEAINAQTPLTTAATQKGEALGIPGLNTQLSTVRGEVQNVKGLLTSLEGDINSRTSGQLLSEAQRRRLLASEETPLRTQLSGLLAGQESAAGQLSQAYNQLGTEMTYLSAEQKRALAPYEAQIAAFSERAARESTGFNTDQQNSLTLLLEKIKRDQALSDREWQQASDAAVLERKFEQTKETMKLQNSLDILKSNATGTGVPTLTADENAFITGALGSNGGTAGASATLNPNTDIWGGFGSTLDNIFGGFTNFPINFNQ